MAVLSPAPTRSRLAQLRWVIGVALAAGMVAWLGVNSAEAASCGHYVKRLGPSFVPGKGAAEKIAAEQAAHKLPGDKSPAESPCGCKGPECHGAPLAPTPFAPNSPLRIPAPQEVTSLAHRDFTIGLGSDWLLAELSCQPLAGFPQRLARPPAAAL
jgi:hypothetical protein